MLCTLHSAAAELLVWTAGSLHTAACDLWAACCCLSEDPIECLSRSALTRHQAGQGRDCHSAAREGTQLPRVWCLVQCTCGIRANTAIQDASLHASNKGTPALQINEKQLRWRCLMHSRKAHMGWAIKSLLAPCRETPCYPPGECYSQPEDRSKQL